MTALAALLGGYFRILFGGAQAWPHGTTITRGVVYALFVDLGVFVTLPVAPSWRDWCACTLVSVALATGWSPGHGSYLNPGNGSADNEAFRPMVHAVTFGAAEGSVFYCCAGMSVRYGIVTLWTAAAMLAANTWLHGHFTGWAWFGAAGFLAGPALRLLVLAHWERWELRPWFNHLRANNPFEMTIGALLYMSLTLAVQM